MIILQANKIMLGRFFLIISTYKWTGRIALVRKSRQAEVYALKILVGKENN